MARRLDPPYSHYMLYAIAFLKGDAAAMQQQVDRVSGTPAEAGMLAMQSVTAAYAGRVRQARELTKRAIELAKVAASRRRAGLYAAGDALWEAAYGNCRERGARGNSSPRVVARPACPELERASRCDVRRFDPAGKLADEMVRRFPQDSFFKASWLPWCTPRSRSIAVIRPPPWSG